MAPGDWSRTAKGWVDYDRFMRGYANQLDALDPRATYDALVALVAPEEPVLLCWEIQPAPGQDDGRQWCHRRQVAEWFKATIGIDVPELILPPGASARAHQARGSSPVPPPTHVIPRPGVEPETPVVPQSWLDSRKK